MKADPPAVLVPTPTSGPAGEGRPAVHWRSLHDQPALPPGTLAFALLAHEHAARAHALHAALGCPDPAGHAARLLRPGPPPHGPQLHGPHLDALSAPHPPAIARALREALGDPAPWTPGPAGSPRSAARLPRLLRLLWQATRPARPAEPAPATTPPADRLRRALHALAAAAAHPAPLTAPLATHLLSRITRHWLHDPHTLHLELLRDASRPQDAPRHALTQLRTTLGGPRRAAALLALHLARHQHHALAAQQAALQAARREALRAAVTAAAALRTRGLLTRTADARWLTPHELIAALDGTLPPTDLPALIEARRAARRPQPAPPARPHTPPHPAPDTLTAAPLAPGVRDGRLRRWTPGQPVPPGAVLLLPGPPHPAHLNALSGARALIVPRSTLHSPVAAHARHAGLPALSLPAAAQWEPDPDWLQEGALVRVNGHTGQLILLRRAGLPDPVPSFDLNLDLNPAPTRPGGPADPHAGPAHLRLRTGPAPFSFDLA
ncbi:hypothetical protein [Deinococcus depolymerans]|uniref:PEP-utilising enzyme mobile domain-containing protein n=1 Tax=Deinococcus depolymerans TaxID=392408 RepID=A0ABN1BM27_9DEIO